jgi:hypothetical protein
MHDVYNDLLLFSDRITLIYDVGEELEEGDAASSEDEVA